MQTVARNKNQTSMVSGPKNHGEIHIFIHVVSVKKFNLSFSQLITIKWD